MGRELILAALAGHFDGKSNTGIVENGFRYGSNYLLLIGTQVHGLISKFNGSRISERTFAAASLRDLPCSSVTWN